jgi:hypothetical protein
MTHPKPTGLLAAAAALAAAGALVLPAASASAGTPTTCRTTLTGGLVGNEVVASSSDVYAEAAAAPQTVSIDRVTVNYFGQTRYRLASSIKLINNRSAQPTAFVGGAGYFVTTAQLDLSSRFLTCVHDRLS